MVLRGETGLAFSSVETLASVTERHGSVRRRRRGVRSHVNNVQRGAACCQTVNWFHLNLVTIQYTYILESLRIFYMIACKSPDVLRTMPLVEGEQHSLNVSVNEHLHRFIDKSNEQITRNFLRGLCALT